MTPGTEVKGFNYFVSVITWRVSLRIYRTLDLFLVNVGQLFEVRGLRNPPRVAADEEPGPSGPHRSTGAPQSGLGQAPLLSEGPARVPPSVHHTKQGRTSNPCASP